MKTDASKIVNALPLPALLVRQDDRIEAANPPACDLLGGAIEGRHYMTALRQPTLLDAIEGCLRDGADRSTQYVTTDGTNDVSYQVSLRRLTEEQTHQVLVCFEDITHLQQVGQMRRDFVANVSHELKTPLTALIGFIETIQGPARNDPEGQARFLTIMAQEAHRMNRLVGDLLSLSRVEADERVRPTERLDLSELIRSTVHGLQPLADGADVSLQVDLPSDPVIIAADADQIQQVLTNLIENGIKYSGAGAQVRIHLGPPQEQPKLRARGVRLEVADTGPGIDPLHLPRLTERFYRVDSHRSREKGGTGLGLAIVKHIINRHRGRLRIASDLGKGTRFIVILPCT
ncbi:MAG: ATP-binding protein [Pelagimonas sp.]|nr:ATP-binding protein [Pelagimonas sp.]